MSRSNGNKLVGFMLKRLLLDLQPFFNLHFIIIKKETIIKSEPISKNILLPNNCCKVGNSIHAWLIFFVLVFQPTSLQNVKPTEKTKEQQWCLRFHGFRQKKHRHCQIIPFNTLNVIKYNKQSYFFKVWVR